MATEGKKKASGKSGKHRRPRRIIGAEQEEWDTLYEAAEKAGESIGDFVLKASLAKASRVLGTSKSK